MSSIKYPITLDLKRDYHQVLIMKEGDIDSREIIITITDNGQPFPLDNILVKFKWHKPDHHFVFDDCTIQDNNAVIKCNEQMLIVSGIAKVEIVLYDDSEHQTVLSTMTFHVSIRDSVIDNQDIESSDEFGTLNNLILSNKNLNDSLKQLESEVEEAENIRISNENTRISNETNRVSAETQRQTNTATAITNAVNATVDADTAAENANTAAKAANTAAKAANTAAKIANSTTQEANTIVETMEALIKNDNLIHTDDLGVANGVATLDENGNIPASQLPGYVDDVLEGHAVDVSLNEEGNAMCASGFILSGETDACIPESGKIYLDTDTNLQYRWTGSVYISTSSVLELGTTSSTAFPGNRGLSLENRVADIEEYHNNIPAQDIKFDNTSTPLLGANVQDALKELSKDATQTSSGLLSADDKKRIDNYANVKTIEILLLSSNWSGSSAPYTQIVPVEQLSCYNNCSIEMPETATAEQENMIANAEINSITYDETIGLTFTATGVKPTIDIPLQLSVGTSMNVVEIPKYFGETPVTGVKGAAETEYRNGNVNITKENIGLGNIDNTADANKSVNYASTAGDSDTVDGYHVNKGTNETYGKIPIVGTNGVMEIGRYLDFHADNSSNLDYSVRLEVAGSDSHMNSTKYITAPYFQCHTGAQLADDGNIYGSAWGGWLFDVINRKLDINNGTFTGAISGGSGGIFGADGNVYINCHGYTDYLTNILDSKLSTSASCNKNWNWYGQGGQPEWVWGGNSGTVGNLGSGDNGNYYVWNPANFNVNAAHSVGRPSDGDIGCGMYATSSSTNDWFFIPKRLSTNTLLSEVNLGHPSGRWGTVYAMTGIINTSDRNLKDNIQSLTDKHLQFFLLLQPVSFTFKDGTSGRTHIGFISQDVEEAMKQVGLTDLDFAGFCKDVKLKNYLNDDGKMIEEPVLDGNGNTQYIYSLRYEEFISINTYATQKLYERVDVLEEDNAKMKQQIQHVFDRLKTLENV